MSVAFTPPLGTRKAFVKSTAWILFSVSRLEYDASVGNHADDSNEGNIMLFRIIDKANGEQYDRWPHGTEKPNEADVVMEAEFTPEGLVKSAKITKQPPIPTGKQRIDADFVVQFVFGYFWKNDTANEIVE